MNDYKTDILVIGAGPAGLFSVFEAGMMGYKCIVVDSLPQTGGQLTELYPEKPIYDIPGFLTILAGELAANLKEQADQFKPTYLLNEMVEGLEKTEEGFVATAGENKIECKVVFIAAGGGMFSPRKPPLENLSDYENKSVFYAVKNKQQFTGKKVAIAGGGDSAVDWAVELSPIAKEVHVIHRREDFRAAEETVAKMHELAKNGNVKLHTSNQLKELHGENGELSSITLASIKEDDKNLKADSLLCFFGLKPTLGALENWGLTIEKKKVIVEPVTMKTNVNGILCFGDMAHYEGKMELILTGFAEAANACKTAQHIINPEKKFKLIYSTSKGVNG